MKLTEKLIFLRKQKGLSQLDVAERLNVSRQAISRWEVGTAVPNTDNLKYLSKLYGVPVDYLLHDDAELPDESTETQIEKSAGQSTEVSPHAKHKRKHTYLFIYALGIVLAIVMGIVIGITVIPGKEKSNTYETDNLYTETNSQSDGTFSFD